ncbi:ABC transporter ATP-binding protein [Candidatus Bathyarchaeota archaeon]|nr:MAG: ABC transporter ATP-binding protein [Candidatus Bathyarchaeota archaeon]RLG96377.1 MAG: ABC transporter ATP-binding protein [Candidatus Bathyarchaeota archaeon]
MNVTKRFGKITALDHINLSIEDGEYVCVLGPTGAGKTTLLRIIAGLLEPDEGEVYIEGKLVNGVPPEQRNAVYMFQEYALFPHMTVWENVSYGPVIKDWERDKVERVTSEILEMVRLAERRDAFPHELSGGMQQRVALARGIASGARILLLDEPLGALDARLRVDIRTQLRNLAKDQGLTVVHVTHDQEEAIMIADRVVILREGRIEQIGTPYEIYSEPRSIFVASFVGGANFIEGNVVHVDSHGSTVELRGGLRIRVSNRDKNVGERVVVAVRYEDVTVGKRREDGSNNLSGVVESVLFIGGFIEYDVKLENDEMIASKILLSEVKETYKTGEHVVVSFPPEKCYVFPYPKTSLLKEIEAV